MLCAVVGGVTEFLRRLIYMVEIIAKIISKNDRLPNTAPVISEMGVLCAVEGGTLAVGVTVEAEAEQFKAILLGLSKIGVRSM